MIYCNTFLYKVFILTLFLLLSSISFSELQKIPDHLLSQHIGQSGISIDREVPLSADKIILDLKGSEGLSVITGDPLDNNPHNDRVVFNYRYQGLTLDVLNEGALSIGLPKQFILGQRNISTGRLENGLNASFYLSESATIKPTSYTTQQQTYTAYINSVSNDPGYDGFTLSLTGANFDSTGNGTYSGNYQENQSNSNIDGASTTFTINDPSTISLSVTSSDRTERTCELLIFCSGDDDTDDGEIIILDANGDLVAVASTVGEDASLTNIAVKPIRQVDNLGSNFFISAKMTGTFNLTGNINIFSGSPVTHRP